MNFIVFLMQYFCFYVKHTGALGASTIVHVHWTIYTYFQWNIYILGQLEHIYTHILNEILIFLKILLFFVWNINVSM